MLDGAGDEVAAAPLGGEGGAADRRIVALAAAAREDDVLRTGAEDVGDVAAGGVEHLTRFAALVVDAGRVTPGHGQVWQHRLEDARVEGRSRGGGRSRCAS